MSELVTYTQAQRLKKLGFDKQTVSRYIESTGEFVSLYDYQKNDKYRTVVHWLKCPAVSEALDFIREKGTVCYVDVVYNVINKKAMYLGKILSESGLIIQKKTAEFDTHSIAESALLDAVLTYLELSKEKKTLANLRNMANKTIPEIK